MKIDISYSIYKKKYDIHNRQVIHINFKFQIHKECHDLWNNGKINLRGMTRRKNVLCLEW